MCQENTFYLFHFVKTRMKGTLGILLLFLSTVYGQDNGGCEETGMKPYDYAQALCMSPLFYEAQRSGKLPADQRVTWRVDSGLDDGADVGLDLTGGYYDAGDYVKFGFPMASTITALAWGMLAYPGGFLTAGQNEYARQAVKWGTDYFMKCHTGPTEFYGQCGDPTLDHSYWGRPEDMTEERPSFKIDQRGPGTGLAGETAAALAATSIVLILDEKDLISDMVDAAKQLYTFADEYRGLYQETIDKANGFYSSYSYEDELPWAALWLYQATGDEDYMTQAKGYIEEFGILEADTLNIDWDDKKAGIYALMAELDGGQVYVDRLESYVERIIGYDHTPKGLVFISDWGSLRQACNTAFIAARAASLGIQTETFNAWAQSQIDYALGSVGHSFVVGFGVNPPTHPHHASSSCPLPPEPCDWQNYQFEEPNPQTLFGALVGGPDENDEWIDDRNDYVHNEVACDYNAFFTGALAAMVELH